MHPDELASANFSMSFVAQPAPDSTSVAAAAEAHARIADVPAGRKLLGDVLEPGEGGHALKRLPVVIAPDAGVIEIVTDTDTDLAGLGTSCSVLEHEGWRVVALVPLARLGDAHTLCRSSGITRVQPYWRHGESIAFGRPEIP